MNTKKMSLLIVEDEPDISSLMTLHLSRDGYEVTVAADGERGRECLASNKYDLAILDWMLPGVSGLTLCKECKIPVLMVTARADATDIVLGLEMGADDYIIKPFELPVFLARVRALLRRSQASSNEKKPDVYHVGELSVNIGEHRIFSSGREIQLTVSEFKLLVALLENRGRVFSRDRLITLVQGSDVNVTDRTIDTHVFGLRKKLGQSADLIETIRGIGYRVKAE